MLNINLDEFKEHLIQAINNGSQLTPKHDPNNLGTSYSSFRTVLSHDLSNNLYSFINSGNFSVKRFENTKYLNSPYYFEITLNAD